MRRTLITAGIIAAVCLIALVLGATAAQAEKPSALERLTPEERSVLEERVPGWKDLSPERQEGIARNVIRIRELPEEKRRALLERIERLKRGREAGRGPRPGRLGHHLDPRRMEKHRHRGHAMRAVGLVLWGELPEATRTKIEATLGERERMVVGMTFFRRLVGRIAKERAKQGVPPIPVPADLPPEERQELATLRAKAEAGDERALERLAHKSVFHDLQRVAAELGRDGPPDEETVRRLGAKVREAYPEAFAASFEELAQAAESEEGLRRYAPRGGRGRHARSPGHQARRLLEALQESGALLRAHPELRKPVKALKQRLEKIVAEMPPEERGPDRMGPGRRGPGRGIPGSRRGAGQRGPRRGAEPPPDAPPPDMPPPPDAPPSPPDDGAE